MRLLYIATNFGSLTHTFIAREVSALRSLGVRVDLLALRHSRKAQAKDPECDLRECRYVYPVSWWRLLGANLRLLATRPLRYIQALRAALASPRDDVSKKVKLLGQLAVSATAVATVEATAPDGMHAHLANPPGSYAMFLSILTGIPFSFTAHAADLYRAPVATDTKLRLAAGVVAISEYNLRHYRELVPQLTHAAVVHCGVRPGAFNCRLRAGVATPLKILAVGRAVPKKGFDVLLDALAILDVPWECHLVGGGPLLDHLQQRRQESRLTNLHITGALQQPEIRALLSAADVFVLPCVPAPDGDVDGIPVSLMEAMASGCPVISTTVSGIPELLADGHAGILVPPSDAEALADALRQLTGDGALASRLSRAGRERIEEAFDIDREARRLLGFFGEIYDGGTV